MALINLLTNLNSFYQDNPFHKEYKGSDSSTPPDAIARGSFDQKSFKFGKDRRGGGSSNQPYIQTSIPERLGEFGYLNQDFILRGGSRALTDSASDVVRLGKYFTDIRNPSGLLFTIKQNLLSRMAVRTQASTGLLNEGIYTPLSTLTEAGGVAFGLHVNKQGLNPFGGVGGISTYSDTIRLATDESFFDSHDRLAVLYGYKILNDESTLYFLNGIKVDSGGANILSYQGGPGSFLGIGNTNIKFAGSSASERTGANNPLLKTNKEFFLGKEKIPSTQYLNKEGEYKNLPENTNLNISRFLGLSYYWDELLSGIGGVSRNSFITTNLTNGAKITPSLSVTSTTLENDTTNLLDPNNNKAVTFTTEQLTQTSSPLPSLGIIDLFTGVESTVFFPGESRYISNINGPNPTTIPGDFRVNLRRGNPLLQENQKEVGNLADAPNYTGEYRLEERTSLGDPGNRTLKNLTSYTNGFDNSGAASPRSYDKINASEIDDENNDLVNFTIKAINNDDPTLTTDIQFRAFLNQISDNFSADWNPTKYIGRGENFYNYGGFDRKVSLSWTVAAQSKIELIPMYKKLNYLASLCAPDYSADGYMRGNLVRLTIGGYFYNQPGIITGFNYSMNEDNSTWEIGIDDTGENDESVKVLPHMIKVESFNFIPIHTFTPKKVESITDTQQRYIALRDSSGTSYD
jgi:hypothetical protein